MSTTTRDRMSHESRLSETTGTMQLVSFRLGKELYGIEITKVREIILMAEITQIPRNAALREGPDQPPQHGHSR